MRWAFVWAIAWALLWPRAARAGDVTFTIAIGNNAPPAGPAGEGLRTLDYADDDALRFYDLFARSSAYAVVLTVPDVQTQRRRALDGVQVQAPSLAHLRQVVSRYRVAMEAVIRDGDRPVLVVTYSGHGARTGEGQAFCRPARRGADPGAA